MYRKIVHHFGAGFIPFFDLFGDGSSIASASSIESALLNFNYT